MSKYGYQHIRGKRRQKGRPLYELAIAEIEISTSANMSNIKKVISFYHYSYSYLDRFFLCRMNAFVLGIVDVMIPVYTGTSPVFFYIILRLIFCFARLISNDGDKAPSGLERKLFSLLIKVPPLSCLQPASGRFSK